MATSSEWQALTYDTALYLLENGVQVIPLAPGKKFPITKDWQDYHIQTANELYTLVKQGHGFGIKPNGSWVYVDIDGDHAAGVDGRATWQEIVPRETADETLIATKANSRNLHMFYRNNLNSNERRTGNSAIAPGVEFSARDSQVRIEPAYHFYNLDRSRPFLDQLAPIPYQLEPALTPIVTERDYTRAPKRANNIACYLAKCEPFGEGERSGGYRRLVYTMVVKWGMPYDEVKAAVDEWDLQNGAFSRAEPRQYEHATRDPN